jgi:hypothetical protein
MTPVPLIFLDETWLFLLLRTLFDVPEPPGFMPKLMIGATSPSSPEDQTKIPRFPLVIVDDIPFSLLKGARMLGRPLPISYHVEYFQEQGTIRVGNLAPPDDPYPSFKTLLASKEWAAMAEPKVNARRIDEYTGHTFRQVLALGRTAYDPPEARRQHADLQLRDFDRHHELFLKAGARWDEGLQLYVRGDGKHGKIGRLTNRLG